VDETRFVQLLEEIRDLQRQSLAELRALNQGAEERAEKALLYLRVTQKRWLVMYVLVLALVIGLVAYLLWWEPGSTWIPAELVEKQD